MSCSAKRDPNGTWHIQYRWTDGQEPRRNPRSEDLRQRKKLRNKTAFRALLEERR